MTLWLLLSQTFLFVYQCGPNIHIGELELHQLKGQCAGTCCNQNLLIGELLLELLHPPESFLWLLHSHEAHNSND